MPRLRTITTASVKFKDNSFVLHRSHVLQRGMGNMKTMIGDRYVVYGEANVYKFFDIEIKEVVHSIDGFQFLRNINLTTHLAYFKVENHPSNFTAVYLNDAQEICEGKLAFPSFFENGGQVVRVVNHPEYVDAIITHSSLHFISFVNGNPCICADSISVTIPKYLVLSCIYYINGQFFYFTNEQQVYTFNEEGSAVFDSSLRDTGWHIPLKGELLCSEWKFNAVTRLTIHPTSALFVLQRNNALKSIRHFSLPCLHSQNLMVLISPWNGYLAVFKNHLNDHSTIMKSRAHQFVRMNTNMVEVVDTANGDVLRSFEMRNSEWRQIDANLNGVIAKDPEGKVYTHHGLYMERPCQKLTLCGSTAVIEFYDSLMLLRVSDLRECEAPVHEYLNVTVNEFDVHKFIVGCYDRGYVHSDILLWDIETNTVEEVPYKPGIDSDIAWFWIDEKHFVDNGNVFRVDNTVVDLGWYIPFLNTSGRDVKIYVVGKCDVCVLNILIDDFKVMYTRYSLNVADCTFDEQAVEVNILDFVASCNISVFS
ncbi:hypothetical protein PCE1_003232 [Barthelona sp. PCE]